MTMEVVLETMEVVLKTGLLWKEVFLPHLLGLI